MALFGNFGDDYTNTGKGGLTRWSNTLSFIPILRNIGVNSQGTGFLQKIPVIGGSITAVLGYVDTIIEAAQWLFRGKIGSAATVLAAGAVSTTVNATTSSIFWGANALSGVTTGASLGTHARAATEGIIGAVTGALGAKPQVLSSYTAGIGSVGSAVAPAGPGKFASAVSNERGQNADQAYANYMNGEGGVHINELQSANLGRT